MRALLVNDDGGPNDLASPYVKYFVEAVEKHTNWDLTICVPSSQKSWIGKAHFAGRDVTLKYIYSKIEDPSDNSYHGPFGIPQEKLRKNPALKEWCLIDDGTPATCADIGINHICGKENVDLVISGPNVGRNSTSLYALSSGTIGGAMEGCSHGKKAIALSYAYEKKFDTPSSVLREAAFISVKIIQTLYNHWTEEVDVYSVNIPLTDDLKFGETKIYKVPMLQNRWQKSLFVKRHRDISDLEERHADIVDESVSAGQVFKWRPDFIRVHQDVAKSEGESDGKVISKGSISVTGLKTIYQQVNSFNHGELKLDDVGNDGIILVTYPKDSYIWEPLMGAIRRYLPHLKVFTSFKDIDSSQRLFHYGEYEDLDHKRLFKDKLYMANSYTFRKALIRKQYFANTIEYYVAKHPASILKQAFPETFQLECPYAEFLDDALDDAYELRCDLEENEKDLKKTFILKPSMSDRGQGIRLFKTIDQLQAIFNTFDDGLDSDDDGDDDDNDNKDNSIILSQMRDFIVQRYMPNPLLLKQYGNRKFHIRTYVLCVGNLKVYVYQRMLMLFSESKYVVPSSDPSKPINMKGHLTNTCQQTSENERSVVAELANSCLSTNEKTNILTQINQIVHELFNAALTIDRFNFQPLPNAFEVYGLDFLVDTDYKVSVLEVNAYPDFKQTGARLKGLIDELFMGIIAKVAVPFFGGVQGDAANLKQVLNIQDHFMN